MPLLASAYPILPGKTEAWKQFTQEMAGPRKDEHASSRQRFGIKQETAFLQQTPMGDMAVIVTDTDKSLEELFQGLAMSNDPFDAWFREKVKELHGLDVTQPPPGPPPEMYLDYRAM